MSTQSVEENLEEAEAIEEIAQAQRTSSPAVVEDETRGHSDENEPRFPAFRHRNFRLFWTGNLISLVGTMAQQTALGWLVRKLTPDPFMVTLIAACGSIPILLLTLPSGVIADRVDKRRALIFTNAAAAVFALLLAIITFFGIATLWAIAVVSLLVGAINALDIPIRQAFNSEMVPREDLPNAIAFNSSAFNGARVAGPMFGGFLLSSVGMAGCFLINTFSFGAIILSLSKMRLKQSARQSEPPKLSDLKDGLNFVLADRVLTLVVLLVACVSLFAMSFGALLPVFAKDVFHTDERGFSALMTCNGLGALGAAVSLAIIGKMRHKGKRLLLGALLFCLSVIGFGATANLTIGCIWLIAAGWFLLTFLMTANTIVQTSSPDEIRGRVFSLYSMALIGTSPLGVLLIGKLAQIWNPQAAVQAGGAVAALFAAYLIFFCRPLWKER